MNLIQANATDQRVNLNKYLTTSTSVSLSSECPLTSVGYCTKQRKFPLNFPTAKPKRGYINLIFNLGNCTINNKPMTFHGNNRNLQIDHTNASGADVDHPKVVSKVLSAS